MSDADGFTAPSLPINASTPPHLRTQEARRAGDHAAGAEALQLLEWELAGSVLKSVSGLLRNGSGGELPSLSLSLSAASSASASFASRLTEKGVLQLMLDVRTVRDALAGGRPAPSPAPAASSLTRASSSLSGGGAAAVVGGDVMQEPSVAAALAERRREWLRLEQQLQVKGGG